MSFFINLLLDNEASCRFWHAHWLEGIHCFYVMDLYHTAVPVSMPPGVCFNKDIKQKIGRCKERHVK